MRPNLPIVPAIFFLQVALTSHGRERWMRMLLFTAPVAAVAIAVAALFTAWYGSPLHSGYGAAEQLFSISNIAPNLTRYPVWLWQSQSPLVLCALLPLVPPFNRDGSRPAVRLCAALFAGTLLSYLVYFQFEEWWYLRFLLVAMPALFVLIATGLVAVGRRLPMAWGRLAVAAAAVLLLILTSRFTHAHGDPASQQDAERRYADVGTYLRDALPGNAIVLSIQESGSIRYYAGRMTIRWDLIDKEWTPRAAGALEAIGLHPFLVLEDFELNQFHDWFDLPPGQLPWPLMARMRERGGISVFDLGSHAGGASPVSLQPGGSPRCSALQPLLLR
jgi:hypothetical protein